MPGAPEGAAGWFQGFGGLAGRSQPEVRLLLGGGAPHGGTPPAPVHAGAARRRIIRRCTSKRMLHSHRLHHAYDSLQKARANTSMRHAQSNPPPRMQNICPTVPSTITRANTRVSALVREQDNCGKPLVTPWLFGLAQPHHFLNHNIDLRSLAYPTSDPRTC